MIAKRARGLFILIGLCSTTSGVISGQGAFAIDAHSPLLAQGQEAQTQDALEQRKTLEGHLQSETIGLETNLRSLDKTLHHLKVEAFDVYTEVVRQDYAVVGEPDVIGSVVIPARPNPSGIINVGGYLPPRKQWLDYFISQLTTLQSMCQANVSSLVLPDDASDDARAELQKIKDNAGKLPGSLSDLTQVTQGPKYDNSAIAQQAVIVQDHVAKMHDACKKLLSECKKSAKAHDKREKELEKELKKQQNSK